MKSQRIYIDTSVIGGCHDEEFERWSNGLMKDFRLGSFKPVISAVVALEVIDAPERIQATYADLLALEHEFLDLTEEVLELADITWNAEFYQSTTTVTLSTLLWPR